MAEEELLDIVDDSDLVVRQAARSITHESGLLHRGVHIFLFTPESMLLVQKRSHNSKQYPDALDCSVSEHVKAGESYADGALRGLHEELGFDSIILTYRMKFSMNYGPGDNHISAVYEGVIDARIPEIDMAETQRVDYYSLSDLEKLLEQETVLFSKWFRELLYWYLEKPSEIRIITENQSS